MVWSPQRFWNSAPSSGYRLPGEEPGQQAVGWGERRGGLPAWGPGGGRPGAAGTRGCPTAGLRTHCAGEHLWGVGVGPTPGPGPCPRAPGVPQALGSRQTRGAGRSGGIRRGLDAQPRGAGRGRGPWGWRAGEFPPGRGGGRRWGSGPLGVSRVEAQGARRRWSVCSCGSVDGAAAPLGGRWDLGSRVDRGSGYLHPTCALGPNWFLSSEGGKALAGWLFTFLTSGLERWPVDQKVMDSGLGQGTAGLPHVGTRTRGG